MSLCVYIKPTVPKLFDLWPFTVWQAFLLKHISRLRYDFNQLFEDQKDKVIHYFTEKQWLEKNKNEYTFM